jgi:hypothetical protein
VHRGDDLGEREHRVAAAVRVGAVRRLALYRDREGVAGGVHGAVVERRAAPRKLGVHVRGDDGAGCERGELAAGEHLGARGVGLLARLERGQQRHGQRVAEPVSRARERDEGAHVHVVAACVHGLPLGAEGRARALAQRHGVQLGAHRDRRPGARSHPRDQPRAGGGLRRHRQLGGHGGCGEGLGVRQLRMGVQPPPQVDRAGELLLDPGEQTLEEVAVSRWRHSGGTARACPGAPRRRSRCA